MKLLQKSLYLCLLISPLTNAEQAINYSDYRAANTPVNYSYIQLGGGIKSYDLLDDNMNVLQISGQTLLNESVIFKMGYQAEVFDETINSTDITYQDNIANIGIGWRYPVFKSTDIELDSNLIYSWNDDLDENNIGGRIGAAVHQGFSETIEGTLALNYSSNDQANISSAELALSNYITRYIAVGINGKIARSDDYLGDAYSIGMHLRLAFY